MLESILAMICDTDTASSRAIENGPWSLQSTQFYSESVVGYNAYHQFCDYIEVCIPWLFFLTLERFLRVTCY